MALHRATDIDQYEYLWLALAPPHPDGREGFASKSNAFAHGLSQVETMPTNIRLPSPRRRGA
jgi:hypothetical protein